jgi:beta-glucosidase
LNQTYACENSKALNGLLKGELGFQGAVVSDYGATKSGIFGIKSGLDMDQPGGPNSAFGANLPIAVRNGSLPESRLDDMVRRIMTPYFFLDQGKAYPLLDPSTNEIRGDPLNETELLGFAIGGTKHRDVRADHGKFVRELGAASAVLLKNNGALPLKNPLNIGVFGNGAADLSEGLFEATFLRDSIGPDYGPMAQGGGSGSARFNYLVSPLEAIKSRSNGALVQYITSNKQAADSIHTIYPIPEVCLVFLKTYAAEGFDRISLDVDWNGTAVVNTVARRCPNTIVVTHSPGINLMPWADNPNVTAIIAAHLPGQEIGNSIVDILYGVVSPTGKLPYTIAYNQSDYNAPIVNITSQTPGTDPWQADFTEGLLIDYRHFDAAKIKPRYEFGFGLSYTSFDLSSASVAKKSRGISELPPSTKKGAPGGNPALYSTLLALQTTVINTGQVPGAAVPQLYVSFPSSAPMGTPDRVLRGFSKTKILKQGGQQTVTFELHRRDVSFWDVVAQDWRIPRGDFTFLLGFSSRDIRKEVKVALT